MILLPKQQKILDILGENLKLARLRRRYPTKLVAERAGISRTTLWNLEKGSTKTSVATLLKVLAIYGLEKDMLHLGEDDILGRKIQDANLTVPKRVRK